MTEQPDFPQGHGASDEPDGSGTSSEPGAPIRLAVALVGAEALALVVLAIAEVAGINRDHPSVGVTTAVFFLLYAAGLALCARGLSRLSSWSRGPIVLAQLIELGIAWSFRGGGTTWVAILLAIPAVIVLIVMFSPATTEALYGHRLSDYDGDAGQA